MQFSQIQNPFKSSALPDYTDFVRKNEPNPFAEKQQDFFANFLTENNQMAKDGIVNSAKEVAKNRPQPESLGIRSASPNANPFDTENMMAQANVTTSQGMNKLANMGNALIASQSIQGLNASPNPFGTNVQSEVNSRVQAQAQVKSEQKNVSEADINNIKPQGLNISREELAGIVWSKDANAIAINEKLAMQLPTEVLNTLKTNAISLDQNSLSILSRASKRQQQGVLTGASVKVEEKKEEFSGKNGALNVLQEQEPKNKDASKIGELSAQYESGKNGISAVAYDRVGGTSYGKFQIASKPGTFDDFVKYLSREAPDIAEQLKKGGPANTGSRNGKMPEIWKDIAEKQPNRFELLQENFIKRTHFDPAFTSLQNSGLDTSCPVLKEVVWSTAVQHGATGAKRIFSRALKSVDDNNMENFIDKVYDLRTSQFRSSTEGVQSAIEVRLAEEKTTALNMLT